MLRYSSATAAQIPMARYLVVLSILLSGRLVPRYAYRTVQPIAAARTHKILQGATGWQGRKMATPLIDLIFLWAWNCYFVVLVLGFLWAWNFCPIILVLTWHSLRLELLACHFSPYLAFSIRGIFVLLFWSLLGILLAWNSYPVILYLGFTETNYRFYCTKECSHCA
jgi:hypothetical protein